MSSRWQRKQEPMSVAAVEAAFLDRVYDAALDPELWPSVLDGLSDLLHAGPINLTQLSVADGSGLGVAARVDPGVMDAYFEHFAPINPFTTANPDGSSGVWTPRVYTDEQALNRDEYVRTEFFNDHMRRVGADWSMVIRLGRSDGCVSTIHLGRPNRQGHFQREELARARRLQPHLIRAYRLSCKLGQVQLAGSLRAALNYASDAMLLTDGTGKILHANAAGERLLGVGAPLCASRGRVTASRPATAARLAALISSAAQSASEHPSGASIELSCSGQHPLRCSVSPVPFRQTPFAPEPVVLIAVREEPAKKRPTLDQLAARYALTPAEGRVALALVDGLSLGAMATKFGVQPNTVRAQLGAAFAKTGVHRQAELVRLLLED